MSQDNRNLVTIPFRGDTILAVETPEGMFSPLKPRCEVLGLDYSTQLRRVKAVPERWRGGLMPIPSASGTQDTYCIPLTKLHGWVCGVAANKVKPEFRDRLIAYQNELDDVQYAHFEKLHGQQDTRIAELERMVWHAGHHLRMTNAKWDRAYRLMEMGQSDYVIAQRCGWSMDRWAAEKAMMARCGQNPKWREDMGTLIDQNSALRWKLSRSQVQPSLFGEG